MVRLVSEGDDEEADRVRAAHREELVAAARRVVDQGKDERVVLDTIAAGNGNAGDAMIALREVFGMSLTEAKQRVLDHPEWSRSAAEEAAIDRAIDEIMFSLEPPPRLRMSISHAEAEVDNVTAFDLYIGFRATLTIEFGHRTWQDVFFPVLELAVQLSRNSLALPFRFVSMNMEEEPSFAACPGEGIFTLVTRDGTTFDVPAEQVRPALERFVADVDSALRNEAGWSVTDVVRDFEAASRDRPGRSWRLRMPKRRGRRRREL